MLTHNLLVMTVQLVTLATVNNFVGLTHDFGSTIRIGWLLLSRLKGCFLESGSLLASNKKKKYKQIKKEKKKKKTIKFLIYCLI